jgi:hypothetical protein
VRRTQRFEGRHHRQHRRQHHGGDHDQPHGQEDGGTDSIGAGAPGGHTTFVTKTEELLPDLT